MRLRNIPRADGVIDAHHTVIKKPEEQKGNWNHVFGNEKPIQIEIGMGKGQFILNMAKAHPEINFIGIERYSSVLLRALEKYDTEEFEMLENIRFICMDAREIENVFAPAEVDKIFLNFSDPWPKARHAKRRLTSTEFLARYEKVLVESGRVEFTFYFSFLSCFVFRFVCSFPIYALNPVSVRIEDYTFKVSVSRSTRFAGDGISFRTHLFGEA